MSSLGRLYIGIILSIIMNSVIYGHDSSTQHNEDYVKIISLSVNQSVNEKQFNRIFLFGDSLSDIGNTYKLFKQLFPQSPPYYKGRFSNGPLWIESLRENLNMPRGQIFNYAFGGAEAIEKFLPIPDLKRQIDEFFIWNHNEADPTALYIIWIGSNDILNDQKEGQELTLINKINDAVTKQIERLIKQGAKLFLIPLLPDLSLTPDAILHDKLNRNTEHTKRLIYISKKYNSLLLTSLKKLNEQYENITFITFDTFKFLNEAPIRAPEYGVTILNKRCNPNWYAANIQPICTNPDEYLFWDAIHPTTKGHKMLADYVQQAINTAGVIYSQFESNESDEIISWHNKQALDNLTSQLITDEEKNILLEKHMPF